MPGAAADFADSRPDPSRPRRLVVGDGAGIPTAVDLALRLATEGREAPLVLLGVTPPLAFRPRPSTILVPGLPDGVIAAHPVLDAQGIPSRLASHPVDLPGCHDGDVLSLARGWLALQEDVAPGTVEAFVAGPQPLLDAFAALLAACGIPGRYALA